MSAFTFRDLHTKHAFPRSRDGACLGPVDDRGRSPGRLAYSENSCVVLSNVGCMLRQKHESISSYNLQFDGCAAARMSGVKVLKPLDSAFAQFSLIGRF